MAAKKHIDVQMGMKNPPSYIEVSALGVVVPAEALKMPAWQQSRVPGWNAQSYDSSLNPIVLNIKAGTEGTITIWVDVDYDYWEMEEMGGVEGWGPFPGIPGKKWPEHETGTVTCRGIWSYECSTTGELTLTGFDPKDSPISDDFSVRVDGFAPSKPTNVVLNARPKYESSYVGNALKLIATLKVTDVPPPPPPPPPKPDPILAPLSVVIPFGKEGQTNLDDKARKIASDWAATLFRVNPALEKPLMRGELPVYFVGYASKTGKVGAKTEQESDDFDVEIGNARAQSVIKYLVPSPLGSGAKTYYKSVGRQQAQWATVYDAKLKKAVEVVGKPRDIDRVVVVWVEKDDVLKILKK